MATKVEVIHGEDGVWKILSTDSKGVQKTDDTVKDIEGMDDAQALQVFQGLVSQAPNKRRAAVSLIVSILRLSYGKMEDFKGAGDPETGQLSDSIKDVFRKAEDTFFDQFMVKEHPLHKAFTGRLPKVNERGESLDKKDGSADMAERYAYFTKSLRKDPSYGASKNMVLNFWAFVGQDPFIIGKDDAVTIIPPEVMRVMVNEAKDVKPADTSWATKLTTLIRELLVPTDPKKPVTLDDARLPGLVQDAKALLGELMRLESLAAERATKRAKPGDIVQQTKDAIGAAGAKKPAASQPGEEGGKVQAKATEQG
jgi:hypothetical protein